MTIPRELGAALADRYTIQRELGSGGMATVYLAHVLRWEWQPGSTLFLVWQQDRFRRGLPDGNVGPRGLWDPFEIDGDQFLAVKVSYWIGVR